MSPLLSHVRQQDADHAERQVQVGSEIGDWLWLAALAYDLNVFGFE